MDLVDKAIMRLQTASEMSLQVYGKPLIITDSGGKDSSVLVDLAIKAKIPIEIQHSHTTADAPETVYFVREKFKRLEADGYKVQINKPRYKGEPTSMWKLIPIKLMPPTRLARYCCAVLKEQAGKDRMVATGVRWDESASRENNRGVYESIENKKENRLILNNDNDAKRMLFENCRLKAKRIVNPIVDWKFRDVWDYIQSEKITVNPLYSCGWERVGCVGCPLANRKKRMWEFAQYPAFEKLYHLAFENMIMARKAKGKDAETDSWAFNNWSTPHSVFLWWMEDKNLDGQINLFDTE